MKPLTKRLTTHCTARTCSSTLPAVFNLGTAKKPDSPASLILLLLGLNLSRKTSLQELASPQYQTLACTRNNKGQI